MVKSPSPRVNSVATLVSSAAGFIYGFLSDVGRREPPFYWLDPPRGRMGIHEREPVQIAAVARRDARRTKARRGAAQSGRSLRKPLPDRLTLPDDLQQP